MNDEEKRKRQKWLDNTREERIKIGGVLLMTDDEIKTVCEGFARAVAWFQGIDFDDKKMESC
jgi:hypothetical protein